MSDVRKTFRQAADTVLKQVCQLLSTVSASLLLSCWSGVYTYKSYLHHHLRTPYAMQIHELELSVSNYSGDQDALTHQLYDPRPPSPRDVPTSPVLLPAAGDTLTCVRYIVLQACKRIVREGRR